MKVIYKVFDSNGLLCRFYIVIMYFYVVILSYLLVLFWIFNMVGRFICTLVFFVIRYVEFLLNELKRLFLFF